MDPARVDAYLERFGADRATPLDELQRRHLERVPFENLDIHLGQPITLTEDALFDKVVERKRGGFCYELNGVFGMLLEALGARVDLVGARVWVDGAFGPPLDHALLIVTWPGAAARQLVDVGFGRFTVRPLQFDGREPQIDDAGTFRITDVEESPGLVDVWNGDTPACRIDPRPLALADFAPMCWYQQTSPASHFTVGPTCSRLDGNGRVTIAGDLLIRTTGGERTETRLEGDEAILDAYDEHFGFRPPRVPSAHGRPRGD